MSKHTPGPWVNRGPRSLYGDFQIWSRSYPDIASVSNEHDEETQANARLIAAAPDLYETLCSMIHVLTEITTATKLDLEKTVIKAKDQATGKEASVSAMTVFIDALSVVSKISGETNE